MRRVVFHLPDGSRVEREVESGRSVLDVLGEEGLKGGFVARGGGRLFDLFVPIPEDVSEVEILN
ncbi:MAG: hypothetical protein GXO29_00460, partial [Thermotogae bacterium]|nr:hypothetical protein [Thermotogota bacterium]